MNTATSLQAVVDVQAKNNVAVESCWTAGSCRGEVVVVIPAKNDQLDLGHTVVLSVAFHNVGTEWNSLPL